MGSFIYVTQKRRLQAGTYMYNTHAETIYICLYKQLMVGCKILMYTSNGFGYTKVFMHREKTMVAPETSLHRFR